MGILNWLENLLRYLIANDLFSPLVAFIGVIISACVLWATVRALREQNRPFVSLSIEKGNFPFDLFMSIQNTGNRTAENVHITSDPKLATSYTSDSNLPTLISQNGEIRLSGITPNQSIKTLFDNSWERYKDTDTRADDEMKITISYKYQGRKYKENSTIDISYINNIINEETPRSIVPQMKSIADSLKKISNKIHR